MREGVIVKKRIDNIRVCNHRSFRLIKLLSL